MYAVISLDLMSLDNSWVTFWVHVQFCKYIYVLLNINYSFILLHYIFLRVFQFLISISLAINL